MTISRLGSKTYFPDRPVLTATLMLRGNKVITDREILVWEVVPSVPELAADLITLHQGGYDVFVENDGNEPWLDARDLSHLNRELRPAGIKLVRLPASPNSALLHLVALASTPPPQG